MQKEQYIFSKKNAYYVLSVLKVTSQLLSLLCPLVQSLREEKYRPLATRLQLGRPRWKALLEEIGNSNKQWVNVRCRSATQPYCKAFGPHADLCVFFSKRVGVFCCGPKGISRTLHRLCNSARSSDTTFEFNKESFSWWNIYRGFRIDLFLF